MPQRQARNWANAPSWIAARRRRRSARVIHGAGFAFLTACKSSGSASSGSDDSSQCRSPVASTTAPVRLAVGWASARARRRASGLSRTAAAVLIPRNLLSGRLISPICIASSSSPFAGHAHTSSPM
jgi:hypothetical protein